MNKNILYFGIAVMIGVFAGYLLFGNSLDEPHQELLESHDHSRTLQNQMWTCAMHPQIMQPEAGDCPICAMDLIPVESSSDGLQMNEIKMTKNAMNLANIQTSIVGNNAEDNEMNRMISLSGKIAANEESNSIQASYFDGRLERLHINYKGQDVKRGQLLATIYAPSLVTAQQELITAISLKKSQPNLYKAVRRKLKLWKLSERQINRIEESGKIQENFSVYATVSGTVSEVIAREGDYVKQGQPILKVSNLNSVWAEFDAYENQIAIFKNGQKIEIIAHAYPNKQFDAQISFIDPILNSITRTIIVRATLNNKEALLKPGMFVTGKLKGINQDINESITISASALLWTGERSLVYVKTHPDEPIFEMREVTIGNRNNETFTINSGLKNGDEIVTNGTFTVDAAAQLQGKKSMMNKGNRENEKITHMEHTEIGFSESFQSGFKSAIKPYLEMKDAFINSNARDVKAYAKVTSQKLSSMNTNNFSVIEKTYLKKSIETLHAIEENDMIENQRDHFIVFNEKIVAIVMNIDRIEPVLFVQKCPMANNSKGAVWLSKDKDIRNPYYGDTMLTCGSVIETIE